jgi:hypothetical protein
MKRIGEWRYSSTHSLTSALDGGEWSASRPGRFTPWERAPGTHWIGVWVVPRAILDAVAKRKIPSHRRESNPKTPIVQSVAQSYTDWAITAPASHSLIGISVIRFPRLLIPLSAVVHVTQDIFCYRHTHFLMYPSAHLSHSNCLRRCSLLISGSVIQLLSSSPRFDHLRSSRIIHLKIPIYFRVFD